MVDVNEDSLGFGTFSREKLAHVYRGRGLAACIVDCWWDRIYLRMAVRVSGLAGSPVFALVSDAAEGEVGAIACSVAAGRGLGSRAVVAGESLARVSDGGEGEVEVGAITCSVEPRESLAHHLHDALELEPDSCLVSQWTMGSVDAGLAGEGEVFDVAFNVTNNGVSRCIGPALYRFCVLDEGLCWTEAVCGDDLGGDARGEDPGRSLLLSRSFPFDKKRCEHVFNIWQARELGPEGRCSSRFLIEVSVARREAVGRRKAVSRVKKQARGLARNCAYKGFRGVHKLAGGKPTVLFATEKDSALSANLDVTRERLRERGLEDRFVISDLTRVRREKKTIGSMLDRIRTFAEADYIIVDDYLKALGQLAISDDVVIAQLWHGGLGFKATGYARWGLDDTPLPFSAHRRYTYGICTTSDEASVFSEIFGISRQRMLPTGIPRMDELLAGDCAASGAQRLVERYPSLRGKRTVLFAPTYRGSGQRDASHPYKFDASYPYEMIDFEALYRACGEDCAVVFQMHPWVTDPVPIPERYADRLVDASGYPHPFDLYHASDALVSDYSSLVFEYALLGKPMLFYAFDEEDYALSRGFHRPYEQAAPGKVCRTFDELLEALESLGVMRGEHATPRAAGGANVVPVAVGGANATPDMACGENAKPALTDGANVTRVAPSGVQVMPNAADGHATDRVIDWILLDKLPAAYKQAISEYEDSATILFGLVFA